MEPLQLGWCQGYMGFKYHMEDAYAEKNMSTEECSSCPPYAIFSRKYYEELNSIDHTKKYDFCFIGAIDKQRYKLRKWIIWFVQRYFTSESIFINTSNNDDWESLGEYDLTGSDLALSNTNVLIGDSREAQFRVIKENMFYFKTMCQSRFILCPAGDSEWSFRFYETLMCKGIPVVSSWHETYRTKEESEIGYQYVLADNFKAGSNNIDDVYIIHKNTELFEKYHLLN
jgi:hypothetical protein